MIIAGFAGIGKSTFCEKYKKNAIDFVVMPFKYINFYEISEKYQGDGEKIKADLDLELNPNWREVYYKALVETYKKYNDEIIVIPTDKVIMQRLETDNIPFIVVYPCYDAKNEYERRFIERGNSNDFLDIFIGEWDYWNNMIRSQNADSKIELTSEQYLTDVIEVPKADNVIINTENYIKKIIDEITGRKEIV